MVYRGVKGCIGVYKVYRVYKGVLECIEVYWSVLECIGIGVYRGLPLHTNIHTPLSVYSPIGWITIIHLPRAFSTAQSGLSMLFAFSIETRISRPWGNSPYI